MTSERARIATRALAAVAVVQAAGCYVATDGLSLPVSATVDGEAIGWRDDGVHAAGWTVADGWIGVSDVTLIPCDASTTVASWQELLLPVAWAHSPDVPDPDLPAWPVTLTRPEPVPLMPATPAPGRYCAVEITLGPMPDKSQDGVVPVVCMDLDADTTTHHLHWPGTVVAWSFLDAPLDVDARGPLPTLDLTLRLDRWLVQAHPDMTDDELLEVVVHAIERGITVSVR